MYGNPAEEWRALTEHYRGLVDEELLELAADYNDLTPTAQQVLRDELRLRKLVDPLAKFPDRSATTSSATMNSFASQIFDRSTASFGNRVPALVPDFHGSYVAPAGPVEYTWKTRLCDCADRVEAWQVTETLRRAGIESWAEDARTYSTSAALQEVLVNDGFVRILVAADQLDQARTVLDQPIPADIVEESRLEPPDFQPPVCPKCGAADPMLQEVDPVNAWKCETCGAEWEDTPPTIEEGAGNV